MEYQRHDYLFILLLSKVCKVKKEKPMTEYLPLIVYFITIIFTILFAAVAFIRNDLKILNDKINEIDEFLTEDLYKEINK
jgi:hypothetical protein